MSIDKKIAGKVLTKLDKIAGDIESLVKSGKISKNIGSKLVLEIDKFSDNYQVAAFGENSLKNHQARVIKRDSDETFMNTFDNPNKVIKRDSDEGWLSKTPASFNADAIDNFDQDQTSGVTDRTEYKVRDLSEWAEPTKPQPSWTGKSGGKSTRQGTTYKF